MVEKFRIQVRNHISGRGLQRFPWDRFAVSAEQEEPDAILVRSADLHRWRSPIGAGHRPGGHWDQQHPGDRHVVSGDPGVQRAGGQCERGQGTRTGRDAAGGPLDGALKYGDPLAPDDPALETKVEAGKKAFAGYELAGHTLGVVGLGKVGCLVADVAIKLGMNVIGYDPEITVEAAWSLPASVKKAQSLGEVLKHSNFLTVHVPLSATRGMIDAGGLAQMKAGAVVLNFSRGGVVDEVAVWRHCDRQISKYVCDFPGAHLQQRAGVIVLPHLGASTGEAEENCAVMVADQLRDYLLDGTVQNSVNFPDVAMPRESSYRVAIANANVPNMVGGISHEMAQAGLNIATMTNKSRRDLAYTLVDVDSDVPQSVIDAISRIEGVLMVRYLPTS